MKNQHKGSKNVQYFNLKYYYKNRTYYKHSVIQQFIYKK
jgi:hypothetical protein